MIIDNPKKIKEVEIVVGIPSYNEAKTIGFVVEQASLGLEKYFPNKKSVIINLDNNSTDGTKEVFFEAKASISRIYVSTQKDIKGKGYNFHNLFLMLEKLGAKVGIVIDADLRSVKPDWIKKMIKPVLGGYDFITPYYARSKTDATITNHLVYPLIYGLLGWDIRQPIGGDFAFSDKMVKIWLKQEWNPTTYQFGIDIFMTLTAIFEKMKIAQVNLGTKIHNSSISKLSNMFYQVTSTLFELILKNRDKIEKKIKIKKSLILGEKKLPSLGLKGIPQIEVKKIDLESWTKAVYDSLVVYSGNKDVIKKLGDLYLTRLTLLESEKDVKKQAEYFFKQREYFLKRI